MSTNITTLAINLLISERIGHRNNLADRIIEIVSGSEDNSAIEKQLKNSFMGVIAKCVENPNCKSRDDFYQLAEFYHQKLNGGQSASSAAA